MPLLETAYLLNPATRRRRARRSERRARRRNAWFGEPRRHAAAARKGWRIRRRRHAGTPRRRIRPRRRNPAVGAAVNPRRRKRVARRRRNPVGIIKEVQLGFPTVIPGINLPLPGVLGTVVNGAVQGVIAGSVVFAGYFASGALVNYVVSPAAAASARAAGNTFVGYWARPLLFAGTAGIMGGLAAAMAPKGKGLLWSFLAGAGPALRAFGGVLYALLGEKALTEPGFTGDLARLATGLSDYIQVEDLYEAGMGKEEDEEEEAGMSDYIQVEGEGDTGMSEFYEAGMGKEEEEETEVVGI